MYNAYRNADQAITNLNKGIVTIMADVDHPNTHVENQEDVDLPRKQPESPKHSGIDPLTEGDTMYPSTNTKADSSRLNNKTEKAAAENEETADETSVRSAQTVEDQENLDLSKPLENPALTDREEPRLGNQRTEPVKADGKVQPQTARPANTNDSDVARGETAPADGDRNAATGEAPSNNAKVAAKNGSGTTAPTAAQADGSNNSKPGSVPAKK